MHKLFQATKLTYWDMQCVFCKIKIVCLLNITVSAAEVIHSPINSGSYATEMTLQQLTAVLVENV